MGSRCDSAGRAGGAGGGGRIHAADPARSPRLMRVLRVLSDGREHSSRELQERADTVAAGTCVSELRAAGYDVSCRRAARAGRRPVWLYSMPSPPTALELAALERGADG